MNWGKILGNALQVGISIKGISDVDEWINEKVEEMSNKRTFLSSLIEVAYEISKMDNDIWQYFIGHLNVKKVMGADIEMLYSYSNYVVNIENTQIKELLDYDINETKTVLEHNIKHMESYHIAAIYGILKAKSEINLKANAILNIFDSLMNE